MYQILHLNKNTKQQTNKNVKFTMGQFCLYLGHLCVCVCGGGGGSQCCFMHSELFTFTFKFTFMHLADAFMQSDLHFDFIQDIRTVSNSLHC